MCLAAQKNLQILYIEEQAKIEAFKSHFSAVVLDSIFQKINKDLNKFSARNSKIFKVCSENKIGFISLDEAISKINKPFTVCMENSRNDKNFLHFFCDEEEKELFQELEHSREIEYWSGGGTGEIKKKVNDDSFCTITSYVFLDSDLLPFDSNLANRTQREIKAICEQKNIQYSILKRRFIESYVPIASLKNYISRNNDSITNYSDLFEEFKNLCCNETRYFFNMKSGLGGDEKRVGGRNILLSKHFYKIPQDKIFIFDKGFGKYLASVYENDLTLTEKQEDAEGWSEINGIVKDILTVI